MNIPNMNSEAVNDAVLDSLVDGELNEDDRRQLLVKLESEPTGWRRCALAFLEAQRWRREMTVFARPPVAAPRAPATQVPTASTASPVPSPSPAARGGQVPWWNARNFGTLLAVAASFVVALGLGIGYDRLVRPSPDGSTGVPIASIAGNQRMQTPSQMGDGNLNNNDQWRAVNLVVNNPSGGGSSQVQVPVREGVMPDNAWLRGQSQGLPPELRRMLEQHGHQVKQQRELVPIQLEDGRQGIVPMDRIEIQPVGNRSFQ